MEVNICLYLRTCIFGLNMFIIIHWKNDAYYSKSESAQRNQELQVGHASDVVCVHRASRVGQRHAASAKA